MTSHETREAWKTAVRAELTRLHCDADQAEPSPFEVQDLLLEEGVTYDADRAALEKQLPPLPIEDGITIIDSPEHERSPHQRERWFYVDTLYRALAGNARFAQPGDRGAYDEQYHILCTQGYES